MSNRFVALASVAIGAIYAAGYVVTSTPASAASISNHSAALPTGSSQNATTQTVSPPTANTSTPDPSTSSSGKASTTSGSAAGGSTTKTASAPTAKSSTPVAKSSSPAKSTPVKSTPVAAPTKWIDGTYQGSGSNRIGTVDVAVTIKNDKIDNVLITQCDTHYPEGDIDPIMPQAVVKDQIANVGYVSGATLSSDNFMNAVSQALQQAHNPKYPGQA